MKDQLLDLVEHTYALGCIDIIKVVGTDKETEIAAMAEDRSVVIQGKTATPVSEFKGTSGMPNLSKLSIILNIPEYKTDAKITVDRETKDGEEVPAALHFVNKAGDFKNDYRFMAPAVINEKLKAVKFKGTTWNVEFTPTAAAIQRMKFQANANAEETVFGVSTTGTDLKFSFGDHSTHAGNFVFHTGITGKLAREWSYPVKQVIAILDLSGDKVMQLSDEGVMQITVDSGLATYNYILPAQSK